MQHKDIALDERIIFALDVSDESQAREWVARLEGPIRFFKVGLELFLGAGFPFVEWLANRGHKVMLDLKFYDVPVDRATRGGPAARAAYHPLPRCTATTPFAGARWRPARTWACWR